MYSIEFIVLHSLTVYLGLFLLAVSPFVRAFSADIVLTSMCLHDFTHLVTILVLDMTAHLKVSHHFSHLTHPLLLGTAGSCQTQCGMQQAIGRPGILHPLCNTAD